MQVLSDWEQRALFITNQLIEADPIWGQTAQVYESAAHGRVVLGGRCGSFTCGPGLRSILQGWSAENKTKLTTWITDQNLAGERFPGLYESALQGALERKPLRFDAKVDRFFRYLNDRSFRVGEAIFPSMIIESNENVAVKNTIMRWIEATNEGELLGFIRALASANLLGEENRGWRVTAQGYLRMDGLAAQGAAGDQAFVAMWFGPQMEEVFDQGISPGLADAGYRAFRVDRKEHSNRIDDEIIAEIRRSRFLVADFTCGTVQVGEQIVAVPRGGVYYEAGFAQGLAMPVIWTVREDQIGAVHFDTRQFNHITWRDANDLRIKLYRRVAAVLGHFGN